jgi:predicted nucleotidyltransferase
MKFTAPAEYRAEYRRDIETAAQLLKNEGCQAVYLFGSMVTGNVREGSDIDIGITGLPPERFVRVYGRLSNAVSAKVDLVDFDFDRKFFSLLSKLGEVARIG